MLYVESSAALKLVLDEVGAAEAREIIFGWNQRISSVLTTIETARAVRRHGVLARLWQLDEVLAGMYRIEIDAPIIDAAGRMSPPLLRSLDAIHLASALSVGLELGAFATYDRRLAAAARDAGLRVVGIVV